MGSSDTLGSVTKKRIWALFFLSKNTKGIFRVSVLSEISSILRGQEVQPPDYYMHSPHEWALGRLL